MILKLEMILSVAFYEIKIIIFYEKNLKLEKITLLMMFFVIEFKKNKMARCWKKLTLRSPIQLRTKEFVYR